MKKIGIILLIMSFVSCKKSIFTCAFSGEIVTKNVSLSSFDTVEVNPMIQLIIENSNANEMVLSADKDIIDNVEYQIVNNKLILTNHKHCTIKNSGAIATVTLKINQLNRIIANTDLDILSANTLHFDRLELICENNSVGTNNIADFDLDIAANSLSVIANGSSIFNIKGSCHHLFVGFYGVNPVFKGKNLTADTVEVFQRSSGDIHLYPVQKITGDLYGYGNIYLYNRPPVINITEHYAGHIFFVN